MPLGRAHAFILTTSIKSAGNDKEAALPRTNPTLKWEHLGGCVGQFLWWTKQQMVGSDWTFPMSGMAILPRCIFLLDDFMHTVLHMHTSSEANLAHTSLKTWVFPPGKTTRMIPTYAILRSDQPWQHVFFLSLLCGSSFRCHSWHNESFLYHGPGLLSLEKS